MNILLRSIILCLTIMPLYADCEEFMSQADCEASGDCEWHADEMACEDVGGDDHDDHDHGDCDTDAHVDVNGLILEYNGVEIYSQFEGLIEGSVALHVNDVKDISVHFLDQNQQEIEIAEGQEDCYPLSFDIADGSIISISMEDDHEGHDHDDDHAHCDDLAEAECAASDDCEWHADESACEEAGGDDHDDHDGEHHNAFELTGLAMGWTTFSISIMHDGHADYTSMPIYVAVEEEVHCEDLAEADCEASDDCEWHADEMACEDVGGDDHDDHDHGDCDTDAHVDVNGLILEYNGVEIYSQFEGLIEGSVALHVNDVKDISVHFLDQNQQEIEIAEGQEDCYPLSFDIADGSIISISMEDDHEGHDHDDDHAHCDDLAEAECAASDDCEWHADESACEEAGGDDHDDHDGEHHNAFELTGLAMGWTTFSISIMHDGHADYTSMPIYVSVEEEACVGLDGDMNDDAIVNILDVVYLVAVIIGNDEWNNDCQPMLADINNDSSVNILDVVGIIDMVLNSRSFSTEVEFNKTDLGLSFDSDGHVGAIKLVISHDENFSYQLTNKAMVSDSKTEGDLTTIVVVYPEDGEIFTSEGNFDIESVLAASSEGFIDTEVNMPSTFMIGNAYPNPFNPSTSFAIELNSDENVSVKVFNIKGHLVNVLSEGYMNAGEHTFVWNAGDIATGLYFISTQVGVSSINTQKVMLVK